MSSCEAPSLSRYKGGACRCDDCRALNVAYMADYRKQRIITGRPRLVPAETARRHLQRLRGLGFSYRKVATLGGVSLMQTYRITTGTAKHIHPQTERAVLAVRP